MKSSALHLVVVSLLFAVSLLLWVAQDILLWRRVFEAHNLYRYSDEYQRGWYLFLYAQMFYGALFFASHRRYLSAILFPAALFVLANSGSADMLYYWLDGRACVAHLNLVSRVPYERNTAIGVNKE